MNLSFRLVKVVFFVVFCSEAISVDYCKIGTCKDPSRHTMCLYNESKVDTKRARCREVVAQVGVTPELRRIILREHNLWRQKVANGKIGFSDPACNMRKLTWNSEAEKIAQRWVIQCRRNPDMLATNYEEEVNDECRDHEDVMVGQNVYEGWLNGGCDTKVPAFPDKYEEVAVRAITYWANERFHATRFPSLFVDPRIYTEERYRGKGRSYHHLTPRLWSQLIWASTRSVGCGYLEMKPDRSGLSVFRLYCNYVPRGNVLLAEMYGPGLACSRCPNNTVCSDGYPGLCRDLADKDDSPPAAPKMIQRLSAISHGDKDVSSKWMLLYFLSITLL